MFNRLITEKNYHSRHPRLVFGWSAKKVLYWNAAGSAAVLLSLLGGAPGVASAWSLSSMFSAKETTTTPTTQNSQTLSVLTPAVNIDPSPAVGGAEVELVDGEALLPQEGPDGTVADLASIPSSMQVSVYTVRKGDTLSSVAALFNVSVNTILWANDIKGGVLKVGDDLTILPVTGIRHTITKGETLASLAKDYHSDAHDIALYNDLVDDAVLVAGTTVIIPNGEIAVKTTTKKSSSTGSSLGSKKSSSSVYEPYLGGSGPALPGYFIRPISGGVITQGLHGWNAIDLGAPRGTAIHAAASGTVIAAKTGGWNGGYGNYVVISHPNGTQTLYAHATKILASVGDNVDQGQTIATVGSTGWSTGAHLHFEVRGAKNPLAD